MNFLYLNHLTILDFSKRYSDILAPIISPLKSVLKNVELISS